jgi:two-component system cell cycle sensor histidine kinase/response regulator CckA
MGNQLETPRDRGVKTAGDPLGALRGQGEFLRQVLDINPNLIFAKDREGRFTLVNKAVADIYGTTVDALIGKTDADFNPDPEQVAFFRRIDLEVMDSLKEVLIPEEVITDADGKTHWLQTVKRPILGPDGVANQVLGVATDITQRKSLEDQLRQAQKMEALGQLAGGVAHDFNNMLAVILGNSERLLRLASRGAIDNQALVTALAMIVGSGEKAATLVSRLLAFSRKQPDHPVVLELNDVVRNTSALLQRLIDPQVRLDVNTDPDAGRIRADRNQFEQVIVNLALNARDAMPDGGTLTLRTLPAVLDSVAALVHPGAMKGRYAVLSVADTGTGMSTKTVTRIFEPFFTTKPAGKGTGLGLAIVYGTVAQMRGFITVDSTPGRGSRFDVYIPAANDAGTPAPASG